MSGPTGITREDEAAQSQVQRPTFSPTDPQGGFTDNPEFEIMGSFDNGGTWNSRTGTTRNPFVSYDEH